MWVCWPVGVKPRPRSLTANQGVVSLTDRRRRRRCYGTYIAPICFHQALQQRHRLCLVSSSAMAASSHTMSGDLAPLQGLKDESCRGSRREEDERLKEGGAFLSFSKKKKGPKFAKKFQFSLKRTQSQAIAKQALNCKKFLNVSWNTNTLKLRDYMENWQLTLLKKPTRGLFFFFFL